eukprot:COSAG02_NODE_1183_length_14014_cov_4.551707_3_plen_128_part_00
MVKHAWKMCAEMLWPVSLLGKDERLRFKHGMVERMCPRLDDVQALALALADGDQLSWVKSTHFIQVRFSCTDRRTSTLTNRVHVGTGLASGAQNVQQASDRQCTVRRVSSGDRDTNFAGLAGGIHLG